ncbi:transducin beta-like protein 3 isoform X2 [Stegodyphus dumicola]|nr:transducin beta-like protein 3 isoform X2 [Stegodyphus dumicola]
MAFDSTTTLLATGGSDSTVKIWDIIRKYYTHNLKGGKGVYSKICFKKIGSELHLLGAADDYQIHVWNLNSSDLVTSLEGHYSTVTDLVFTGKQNNMLSCSRDKVVLLWDLCNFKLLKTIPVYETVEACILLPQNVSLPDVTFNDEDIYFITAGDKGILRIWSTLSGKCIFSQADSPVILPENSEYAGSLITQATYIPALDAIGITTFEHNILIFSIDKFTLKKQFIGYNDDILSIKFMGAEDDRLAVATNSAQIKIFQFPSLSCQLLKGHLDIVLALDVFRQHKHILVSGSKDNSVKVWFIENESSCFSSLYTGYGHTNSVTAVACCRGKSRFFASGSQDTTLKLWEVPESQPVVTAKLLLTPFCTAKAHDKHINSIDISENDKLVATGSQDHTAKIWNATDLSLLGTLRGHKKGVWCVNFSPVDLAIVTSSGDETIRIWSVVDFTCLKTFQGHEASVLQALFLTRGTQLISSSSDGNIKLWDITDNMCIKSLAEHSTRVWTLATSSSEQYLVSGGADSNIVIWQDVTGAVKEKSIAEKEQFILQEQQLSNLILEEKWVKALGLAISLNKPYQTYNIIQEILHHDKGEETFEGVFSSMRQDQKESLLKFAVEWITNSKTCYAAILIVNYFNHSSDFQELLKITNIASYVRNTLPYLDRHYKRLNRRCQDMQILNFLCQQFKLSG